MRLLSRGCDWRLLWT